MFIYIYPEELDGEPWGNITALYSLLSQGGRSFNVFSERMSFLLFFFASTHSSYLYHEYNKDKRYVYANNHSRDLGTKIRKIIQKKFFIFFSQKSSDPPLAVHKFQQKSELFVKFAHFLRLIPTLQEIFGIFEISLQSESFFPLKFGTWHLSNFFYPNFF